MRWWMLTRCISISLSFSFFPCLSLSPPLSLHDEVVDAHEVHLWRSNARAITHTSTRSRGCMHCSCGYSANLATPYQGIIITSYHHASPSLHQPLRHTAHSHLLSLLL